jgi:hypothetical protein
LAGHSFSDLCRSFPLEKISALRYKKHTHKIPLTAAAFSEGFSGKWMEFLKEAVPEASHVAFLQFQADAVMR